MPAVRGGAEFAKAINVLDWKHEQKLPEAARAKRNQEHTELNFRLQDFPRLVFLGVAPIYCVLFQSVNFLDISGNVRTFLDPSCHCH
jgi:hypothetical protein